MPPPIAGALLKSVVLPPSRRHHHHRPPSPLHYCKPSLVNPPRIDAHRAGTSLRLAGLVSAAGGRGKGRWMRPRLGPPPLTAGVGPQRRWVGGGGGGDRVGVDSVRTHVAGSLQQRQSGKGGQEIDGGCKQLQEDQQEQPLITLPTALTLARVAAVPLLVSTFYISGLWATTATTSIFVAAAITDWLDGYIARKMQLRTTFGAFLDPVADKLMVATTLILLCSRPLEVAMFGEIPWLLTVPSIVIIGREITMSAVREWAASQDTKVLEAVAVSNMGKWKTATQMTALTILLVTRDSSLTGPSVLVPSGVVLLYISSGLALWSLVVYMKKIWRILLK